MRWMLAVVMGALVWTMQPGCAPSMTETPAEIRHRHAHITDVEQREMREDIELFLKTDRPSKLTKWTVE
jgi:hypothetical protein